MSVSPRTEDGVRPFSAIFPNHATKEPRHGVVDDLGEIMQRRVMNNRNPGIAEKVRDHVCVVRIVPNVIESRSPGTGASAAWDGLDQDSIAPRSQALCHELNRRRPVLDKLIRVIGYAIGLVRPGAV